MKWITAQTFHIMDELTQKSLSSMPGPIMGTTGLRIARPYYGHHRTSYKGLVSRAMSIPHQHQIIMQCNIIRDSNATNL